jgi:hypothetical protein
MPLSCAVASLALTWTDTQATAGFRLRGSGRSRRAADLRFRHQPSVDRPPGFGTQETRRGVPWDTPLDLPLPSLRGLDLNQRPLGYEFCISRSAQAYLLLTSHLRSSKINSDHLSQTQSSHKNRPTGGRPAIPRRLPRHPYEREPSRPSSSHTTWPGRGPDSRVPSGS